MTAWIGVDLDGTLAQYDSWKGHTHIGPPVDIMVNRVKRWLADGYSVKIFTARVSEPDEESRYLAIKAITEWCVAHIGQPLPVTNVKDFAMLELWDDRAVQVEPNTGLPVGGSTRGLG